MVEFLKIKSAEFDQINYDFKSLKGRHLAILFLAWLSLFAGVHSIPVAEHEAYVLQTAREMSVNSDLVLPYFNQTPRLNKPPLNYWLTLGLSYIDPFSDDIDPWHGRAWSMIAALLLVLATAYIGTKLYGGPAGFLASALLLSSKGFTVFSHDARPDFLYSALCVFQLFAWIAAWRAEDDSRSQRLNAALGWGLAALATLSKGPQGPAVFLLGFLLFLLCGVDRTRALKVLRPFSGLLICLAICLPWWLSLQVRVGMLGVNIGETQLSGSLLETSSIKDVASLFYVSRLLDFLLPASLLVPLLFFLNRKRFGKPENSDRLFLYVVVIFLIVFTVAGHQRSRYLLPLLPLAALLLAKTASRTTGDCIPEKAWKVLFWMEVFALMVYPAQLILKEHFATGLLLLGTGLLLTLLLRKELLEPAWPDHPFATKLLVCFLPVTLIFAGYNSYSVRSSRIWERDFSLHVAKMLSSGDLLVAVRGYPPVLSYYARHPVISVNGLDELGRLQKKTVTTQNMYLIVTPSVLADVNKICETSMLSPVAGNKNPDNAFVLAKVSGTCR